MRILFSSSCVCQQLERETDRHSQQRNVRIVKGNPNTHHAERWKQEAALEKPVTRTVRLYFLVQHVELYVFRFR